jgi:hypothetical protein
LNAFILSDFILFSLNEWKNSVNFLLVLII